MVSRLNISMAQRITQHKKSVPYGTHPNFCFTKTSFILGPVNKFCLTFNWRCIE